MPQQIKMEQNDEGQMILDDPFLGADVDEEEDSGDADFGNDFDGSEETEEDDDTKTEEASDTETEEESEEETEEETEEEETEEETEEESEEEETEEETPPVKAKDKEQRIPKQRFDEVNERRKAAEKELADYKAALAASKAAAENAYDFDAAEKQYMEFVVDGEFEKAQTIRKEIRAAERAEIEALAQQSAANAREATKADLVFQDTVQELEVEYPSMVEGHADYNQELVDEVLTLHEGFLNQGVDPVKAIRKAVKYVAKMNDIKSVSESQEAAPAPEPKTPGKKPASKTDMATKVKAKTTQPQQLPKDTAREPAIDMQSLSEEEFDALPESKKRELRGDFI